MQTDPFLTTKQTTAPDFESLFACVAFFKRFKSRHGELRSCLVRNSPLSSAAFPPKIAHHQPNSQQTNKSCRPSYCHLSSSLCNSSRALLLTEPRGHRSWIKTWQIRLLITEEGRVDGDRGRVTVGAAQFPAPQRPLCVHFWHRANKTQANACVLVWFPKQKALGRQRSAK